MPTHNLFSVRYIEQKKEVICYFKNNYSQIAKRFSFIPYFFIDDSFDFEKLNEILFSFNIKNFYLDHVNNKKCVFSSSYLVLKKISNIIALISDKKFIVLSPERVFLINKDWSYFDDFEINETNIQKIGFNINLNFFDYYISNISFLEALKLNENKTNLIINNYVISNFLKIPIKQIPVESQGQLEVFLENIYFSNAYPINWKINKKFFKSTNFAPYGAFENISKIDFSSVWLNSLTNTFFNLGPDTLNCSCCKPIKLDDLNLLPSSLIEIIPLEDNLFFISTSNNFSNNFNSSNPNKMFRLSKKKEFFLKNFPVGPLCSKKAYLIPIDDAKKLLDSKKVILGKNHLTNWFCKKNESFVSKEIKKLNSLIILLEKDLLKYNINLFFEKDFNYYFKSNLLLFLRKISLELPSHLTNPISNFFEYPLAKSVYSIQESILCKFVEFSEKSGHRVVYSNNESVFVKGHSSLLLANNFAVCMNLPKPKISEFSTKTCFR